MKTVILGRGRVGRGLARALRRHGAPVELHAGHWAAKTHLGRSVVVLAVPDAAIGECARRLVRHVGRETVVVHCAGARGPEELEACARAGAAVGVLHPLVSFAEPHRAPPLEGATFMVQGSPAAIRATRHVAHAVGARTVVGAVHGGAYHAAAALVANGAAALAHVGVRVVQRLGVGQRDAERAMGALLRSVADNVVVVGVPAALTGPIARGDRRTVRAHLAALAEVDERAHAIYRGTASAIIDCALDAGLSRNKGRSLRRLLDTQSRRDGR